MADFDIGAIVRDLHEARHQWRQAHRPAGEVRGIEFPSREALATIVGQLKGVLFPLHLGPPDLRQESEDYYVGHTLDTALGALLTQVRLELRHQARHDSAAPNARVASSACGSMSVWVRWRSAAL